MLKKLLIVLGSIVGLLVIAALVLPFVVNVDKYRPLILEKANQQIHGKLEIGRLGLSLWGKVKVEVDGVRLSDPRGNIVFEVKDAALNVPLLPILSGHPEVRLALDRPEINIVRHTDGKLNAMALLKETKAPEAGQAAAGGAQPAPAGGAPSVPAIVMNSRITFLIGHAKVNFKDDLTGDLYKIDDLNVKLENVSPSSEMPFEVVANLNMTVQKKIKVAGPLVFDGSVKAEMAGGEFAKATAKAAVKLDGLDISYPGIFEKAPGVALGADMEAVVGKDTFTLPVIKFRLADVTVDGNASGKTADKVTTVSFKAHSNKIDIAKLGALLPMVKEYSLNGNVELGVTADGPTDKLGYTADCKFGKIKLSHASMKQPVEVNGSVAVITNELKSVVLKLGAKDFDLSVNGAMQNFAAPRFKFEIASNKMDLDELLKASEKAAEARKARAEAEASGQSAGGAAATPPVDYNAMFMPLRENPITAASAGTVGFNLKMIKSTGVVMRDLKGQFALNNLQAALKDFSMGIFDGTIKGNMTIDAKSVKPVVGANLVVAGLQTQKMVESQMPIARNTIKGAISANLNIGGAGLNQTDIISGWKGTGGFGMKNAVFSTLDIGKQVKEGVVAKLPDVLKGKIPDSVVNVKGEYDEVSAKFGLASGTLNINDITGKAHPQKGFDFKGNGAVKLADYGLNMEVTFIDAYDFIKDKTFRDQKYGHVIFPAKIGNTLFQPKFDWGNTATKLAENALRNRGADELKKRLGNKVPGGLLDKVGGGGGDGKPAPKPADAVKAFKGLFGH